MPSTIKSTAKSAAPAAAAPTAAGPTAAGKRVLNFAAGPAVLPEPVIRQAQQDLWSLFGTGIGIMEHSHRGKAVDRVFEEAEADCRAIAGISADYAVLFLQGGASLQFAMVPMNFLHEGKVADYPDTGVWTTKAIKEAKLFGRVSVAFEGSRCGYDHTPSGAELKLSPPDKTAYLHYCSNNTIYGTRYAQPPKTQAPLVCDASSEIFSRPIDIERHALVYAGAQKNLGPAGATLVILRRDFMARAKDGLPSMLDYRKHAEQDSRLNTPPVFAVYVIGRVFKWILERGGLAALEKANDEKAAILYDAIDGSGGFYRGVARDDCRSTMNVTFRTPSAELDQRFVQEADANEMSGLKGHRDAGGLRASIYNAFPMSGCRELARFMKDFAARNG